MFGYVQGDVPKFTEFEVCGELNRKNEVLKYNYLSLIEESTSSLFYLKTTGKQKQKQKQKKKKKHMDKNLFFLFARQ